MPYLHTEEALYDAFTPGALFDYISRISNNVTFFTKNMKVLVDYIIVAMLVYIREQCE